MTSSSSALCSFVGPPSQDATREKSGGSKYLSSVRPSLPGPKMTQLVKENDPVAVAYKNQSVLEQNSVDLAYDLVRSLNQLQFLILLFVHAHTFPTFPFFS